MPFGICTKPLKDDLTKDISVLVEIPDKSCIEVTLSKDAIGLECLENVAKDVGLEEVRFTTLALNYSVWKQFYSVRVSPASVRYSLVLTVAGAN